MATENLCIPKDAIDQNRVLAFINAVSGVPAFIGGQTVRKSHRTSRLKQSQLSKDTVTRMIMVRMWSYKGSDLDACQLPHIAVKLTKATFRQANINMLILTVHL